MKKKIDPTVELVKKIYAMSVPSQSEISNPFSQNSRIKSKIASRKSIIETPESVKEWNTKHFVNYFADKYVENFNGIYNKTYSSDCTRVSSIMKFMDANELDKYEWTKIFIDWTFDNKDFINKTSSVFSLTSIIHYLNTFFQQYVMKETRNNAAIDIYEEVMNAVENGKTKEVLSIYGIPIISTYFINRKNIETSKIENGLNILFNNLLKSDLEELNLLEKIVQRSISRSPYPDNFELLNWRQQFPQLSKRFKKELWWRDNDYNGNMQFKYDRFLKDD